MSVSLCSTYLSPFSLADDQSVDFVYYVYISLKFLYTKYKSKVDHSWCTLSVCTNIDESSKCLFSSGVIDPDFITCLYVSSLTNLLYVNV